MLNTLHIAYTFLSCSCVYLLNTPEIYMSYYFLCTRLGVFSDRFRCFKTLHIRLSWPEDVHEVLYGSQIF